MPGAAEEMTGDAVIAVDVAAGRRFNQAMLRGIVHEERRIAVRIVPPAMQRGRDGQPGRENNKGL